MAPPRWYEPHRLRDVRRSCVCIVAEDEVIFMEGMATIRNAILDRCNHLLLLLLAQEETWGAVIRWRKVLRAKKLFLRKGGKARRCFVAHITEQERSLR